MNQRKRVTMPLWAMVVSVLLVSCGGRPPVSPDEPYWKDNDRKPIPEPEFKEPPLIWTVIDRSIFDQALELLDMDRNVRKVSGRMTEAKNINSYDEVPNSSWFTNRMGLPQTRPTPEQVSSSVDHTGEPDTTGPWMVFRPKIGGATPGFWIEDRKGNKYIIKFDPKGYPDLSTGATTMAGRFFHACGYNVAQETIVYWRPEILRIREGATVEGAGGEERPLTMEDINHILERVEKQPDGRIRSLASLLLGNVKGPFSLNGTRDDDPNDWCPHEHRRELRGLYVMASFVNHFDIKDHNSMDVYIGEDGEGYLDHYLLDFGSTFGSAGHSPQQPVNGYANLFDFRDVGVSILSLGLKKWQWEDAKPPTNVSVGYFESDIFHPGKWDPVYPIPPFENMTDRDGYWGAKIVMAFRDEYLRALLKAGEYADKEAEEYLFRTMKERRDKIGRYWFGKINPLDYPVITRDGGNVILDFDDLSVLYGLQPPNAVYRVTLRRSGKIIHGPIEIYDSEFSMTRDQWMEFSEGTGLGSETDQSRTLDICVKTSRDRDEWSTETIFRLVREQSSGQPRLVAIER